MDKHKLVDDNIPIIKRLDIFLKEIENLGCNLVSIQNGTLDEHLLSSAFEITPQIVLMYFGLYLIDDEEKKFLSDKQLDTGLIATLMLIEPEIRSHIYKNLDTFLEEEFPITNIITYIDNGDWRIRIQDVFREAERDYWAAVSSHLKDTDTISGTITKGIRKFLMDMKIYRNPTERVLAWIERAIIHDNEKELDIFTNKRFKKDFPKAIKWIEKYLGDYKHYDLYQNSTED